MATKGAGFDVISEVNMGEVKNAARVALKELRNRFGFKGSIADIKLENDKLVAIAGDDYKVEQVKDILFGKLVGRNVPIKNIHFSESEKALGGTARQCGDLISDIDEEDAKRIDIVIKNSGIKTKSQVQEDKTQVTGKSRDDLQRVMAPLRELDLSMTLESNSYH